MFNDKPFRLVLCWILMQFAHTALGQHFPMLHYDIDDGIPSNTIYTITKAKNGYLWFATNKGLARFNGTSFQNFSTFDHLPGNDIFNVREDYEGRLWLAIFNGSLCYYKNNTFHTPENTPWLRLPFKSNIIMMFLQKDSSVNVVFNDQTKFANILHDKIRIIPIDPSYGKKLLYVGNLGNGEFQLVYNNYIQIINADGSRKEIKNYKTKGWHFIAVQNSIEDTTQFYGNLAGLYALDESLLLKFKKTTFDISYHVPVNAYGKNIFIGLIDGFTINDSIKVTIGEHVSSVAEDRDGNFWISTRGKGAFYLSKHFRDLKEYTSAYEGSIVYSRYLNSSIYFVTNDGSLYQKKDHKITLLLKGNNNGLYLSGANFLLTDEGMFLKFAGSKIEGVKNVFENKKNNIHFSYEPQSGIKEMLQDEKNIYFGGISSIEIISKRDITNSKDASEILIGNDLQRNRILGRTIDTNTHTIWYTQKNNVYKLSQGIIKEQPQFGKPNLRLLSILGENMLAISEANDLVIYSNYNSDKIQSSVISQPNCLWENIYAVNDHSAIISTNNYYRLLTLLPTEKGAKARYTIQSIESPFVPQQAEHIASDKTNCYFFKNGTITTIPLNVLSEKTMPSKPVFTELKTEDSTYFLDSSITIPYGVSKSISLKFDNISFTGKDISVEYSISKSDEENWIATEGNEINISNPGYGTYKIKLRSKTTSSEFSVPVEITLIIEPPIWAEWWFIALVAILLLVCMWFLIRFLIRRKLYKRQSEHDAEMKYQQSEYKALNALMNPHFIFNSLNNIQGLINKDSKETANQYLVIFSRLIRQNMVNISKGFISLEQELTLVENYLSLEKLRFKDLVNFTIHIDTDVETDAIMIPPLLIQPLVENAIIHGLLPRQSVDSMVNISVSEVDDILYVTITDNGIGLSQSLKKKNTDRESYGLANLNKRIEHLGKIQKSEIKFSIREIFDEREMSKGTEARISIDLH